ncbi:MAG: hypothetical protein ACM34L_08930 [Gemmatimonas sp.]
MRKLLPSLVLGSGIIAYLAACSSDSTPTRPNGSCTGSSFTVATMTGRVIPEADLPCLSIPADGGTYLVVPQFVTATSPVNPVDFTLSAGAPGAAVGNIISASRQALPPMAGADLSAMQRSLDRYLRSREREVAAAARSSGTAAGPLASRVPASAVSTVVGASATFHVLSSFSNGSQYTLDTAILKYSGSHLLIYVSKNAPSGGFTDAQIAAFGNTFDLDLYTIDVSTFGPPTDIDANGRVIVLLSPLINKLTTASDCSSKGYIAGFFNAVDLLPAQYAGKSNGAEIFYSLVPDPNATLSCTHTVAAVLQLTPSTFIHEFQHMISFGQHAILRNGNEEDPWLNEGLSHVAEELGSRFYENRFPPPTGRTDPDQAFPDSAQGFISGDLYNSYHFLLDPASTDSIDKASVTNWGNGDGTLVQRGGVWLFLRWLGDQLDSTVYGRLDQTSLTGIPNVENASGASFPSLFGEFSLALYVDSLPGIPRTSIPTELRFTSRNLRALYAKANQRNPSTFPKTFPIEALPLTPGNARSESMNPGTMDFFILTAPSSGSAIGLTFAPTSGTFSGTLGAQVSVFHCPSAAACPLSVP